MPRKIIVTPPKFMAAYRYGNYTSTVNRGATESYEKAVDRAKDYINRHRASDPVGIYKLVAVVTAKEIPVNVDTVMKGEK